jgi:hypothetical protein
MRRRTLRGAKKRGTNEKERLNKNIPSFPTSGSTPNSRDMGVMPTEYAEVARP